MTPIQDSKGIKELLRWLDIRTEEGKDFPASSSQLRHDVMHSSLLRRLVDGKEPLDRPPPISFSQPDYRLIEKGSKTIVGVPWIDSVGKKTTIVIENSQWDLVRELGPDHFEVSWPGRDDEIWTLSCVDRETRPATWQLKRKQLDTDPVTHPALEHSTIGSPNSE